MTEGADPTRREEKILESKPLDSRPIRVLILAQVRLYSRVLAEFLRRLEHLHVVGVTEDVAGALDSLGNLRPDIALIDMGIANSALAVQRIAAAEPTIKIIAFVVSGEQHELAACARARVAGYVALEEDPQELVVTIQSVARGEMRCSPRAAAAVLDGVAAFATERASDPVDIPLTVRELQVLELIARGLSNKEIARHLSIQIPTVKNHVHNILAKLKVNRRTEAVARLR
jgi:two-component system, NarL family, nitrate/nitrite response regulator NarL